MENHYRVCVQGHLDGHWSGWLADLAVRRLDDGTTELTGPLGDQAALYGVLAKIRDLGLALLSVNRDVARPEMAPDPKRVSPVT